ncbi:MAG: flagellin, partial [Methanosarcina sp.]
SQEVVHTGVTQASSSLAPSGDVIVLGGLQEDADPDTPAIDGITFYITNTAGGTPVDLDKTIITYADADEFQTQAYDADNAWDYTQVVFEVGSAANLVEKGEKYKIELNLHQTGDVVLEGGAVPATPMTLTTKPVVNEKVKIEVKPPEGAVLILERRMPPSIVAGNYYPVY